MVATEQDDVVVVRRTPVWGGIDLIAARFVKRRTAPHSHPEVEIGVVVSGRRRVWCHDRSFQVDPGSILVFRPGEVHGGSPTDEAGVTYRSFVIPEPVLVEACGWVGPRWFSSPVVFDPHLARMLVAAHEAVALDPGQGQTLLAALTELSEVHRVRPVPPATTSEAVRRVRAYLDQHYHETIRLSTLAEMANLSVFHLIRTFRRATGLPPYAYLAQVRVDRAARLLREGTAISEVACLTGFADQSHLTRFFKRLVGVPPGQFQRHSTWIGN